MRLTPDAFDRGVDEHSKLLQMVGGEVGQIGVLPVVPHLLRRIELWGVSRQLFQTDVVTVTVHIVLDNCCLVNLASVEDDDDFGPRTPSNRPQETHEVLPADVAVLNPPVQAEPTAARRQGNGTDDGQPVVPLPLTLNGCLPFRRPSSADQRLQHEAALVPPRRDATHLFLRVFLYGATPLSAIAQSRPHPFL